MELIDRQAAIKSLRESEAYDEDIPNRADGVRDAIIDIMSLPTIEEREKSQWIKMSDANGIYYACNACGEEIPRVSHFDRQFDLFPRLKSLKKTNFCPNCGADMRGEADGKENTD